MKRIISIKEKAEIYENESIKKRKEYILSKDFEDISWDLKREFLIYESENTCSSCKLNEWMGLDLTIEINHINGDNKDHSRENLECLCPNCHSITNNWRGRNKSNRRLKTSNKELLEILLKNDWNFRKSLIEIGLTPKGGNYGRCHQIKREYEEFGKVIYELTLVPDYTKEEFEEVFNRCDTYTEVSELMGHSKSFVMKLCEKFELKKTRISLCPSKEVLLKDFDDLKYFTRVGRKYGISDNAIRKWCLKYDILEIVKNL